MAVYYNEFDPGAAAWLRELIRQRLFWVADAKKHGTPDHAEAGEPHAQRNGHAHGLADAELQRTRRGDGQERAAEVWRDRPAIDGVDGANGCVVGGRLVYPSGTGLEGNAGHGDHGNEPGRHGADAAGHAAEASGVDWSASRAIVCRDGKARRIPASAESVFLGLADGLPGGVDPVRLASAGFPLAGKVPNRIGLLRGYGNAIVPQVAAAFVEAFNAG